MSQCWFCPKSGIWVSNSFHFAFLSLGLLACSGANHLQLWAFSPCSLLPAEGELSLLIPAAHWLRKGHVLLSAPITMARAVKHPGETWAECQPHWWRCEGAVAEGESRLGCTHHGLPSLAWLPLPSPLPAESSLRLTTAWHALQTSTYHLSTYGSFWICHLVFPGAALSCPPHGLFFFFFFF